MTAGLVEPGRTAPDTLPAEGNFVPVHVGDYLEKNDKNLGDRYAVKVRMNRDARYDVAVLLAEARTERLNDERQAR